MPNAITNKLVWRWFGLRKSQIGKTMNTTNQTLPPAAPRRTVDQRGEHCCGISDIGKVRDGNEDTFLVSPDHGLFVVADGLGGHAAGEVASALIAETVYRAVTRQLAVAELRPGEILGNAFQEADQAVREYAAEHPECRGMGATLIVALISPNRAIIAHAGDTRGYLSRGGFLRRLTNDHTSVGRLLRSGLLSEDEARGHPERNTVSQAVMGEPNLTPEFTEIDLDQGDCLMLCSDGLWDEVSHGEIERILADHVPAWQMAIRLVDRAIASGGNDNITTVVYQHGTKDAPAAHSGSDNCTPM